MNNKAWNRISYFSDIYFNFSIRSQYFVGFNFEIIFFVDMYCEFIYILWISIFCGFHWYRQTMKFSAHYGNVQKSYEWVSKPWIQISINISLSVCPWKLINTNNFETTVERAEKLWVSIKTMNSNISQHLTIRLSMKIDTY